MAKNKSLSNEQFFRQYLQAQTSKPTIPSKKSRSNKRSKPSANSKVSKKTISKSKPKANKRPSKVKGSITSSKTRNQNSVIYTYHNVDDIHEKIELFKNANHDKLKKLVSRSRAKSVILIFTATYNKEDYEKANVSPPEQDITFSYVYGFVVGSLEKMAEDFTEWLEMDMEGETNDDQFDYGNFIPELLSTITVKAILFKKPK